VNPSNVTILSTWNDSIGDWSPVDINGNPTRANSSLPAELSFFLTGINQLGDPANALWNTLDVRSPNNGNPKRNFDDLARRDLDIHNVAGMSCSGMLQVNRDAVLSSLRQTGRLPVNLFEGVSSDQRLSVGIDDIKRNVITEVH
jgi:hypothetical protein